MENIMSYFDYSDEKYIGHSNFYCKAKDPSE